ncbi:MAG: cadherin-like domain-containing protein [Oscillospiraceae bacterium]|nr:cadherin-like domain-containing protein [Oscillospiraceae bacterium]
MFPRRMFRFLLALGCVLGMAFPTAAAEVESGTSYCFSVADFSPEEDFTGICITDLPRAEGVLCLGTRILQPGDILTAQQIPQMTFAPMGTEEDRQVSVGYLPIFKNHVAEESTMTLSILGKEDKPPVAEDLALETYKNLPGTGKLKVSDPEGQALTYTVIRQPKRGTVEIQADGSFTYTPKKNKVGVDSFVYTAADPAGKVSREATVTVTILKPSDAKQYQDTIGSDCRFAAEWMRHTGIFTGENLAEKSCFSPDKEVTRGEFVTMLVKTLDIPVDEGLVYTGYTDEVPLWLQPYLAAAVRSGLTAGLSHPEVFGAEDVITTAEAAVMVANGLDLQEVFSGAETEPLTRAMAAKILYRTSRKLEEQKLDTIV